MEPTEDREKRNKGQKAHIIGPAVRNPRRSYFLTHTYINSSLSSPFCYSLRHKTNIRGGKNKPFSLRFSSSSSLLSLQILFPFRVFVFFQTEPEFYVCFVFRVFHVFFLLKI